MWKDKRYQTSLRRRILEALAEDFPSLVEVIDKRVYVDWNAFIKTAMEEGWKRSYNEIYLHLFSTCAPFFAMGGYLFMWNANQYNGNSMTPPSFLVLKIIC